MAKRSIAHENPAFVLDLLSYTIGNRDEMIVTTKLDEIEKEESGNEADDDDDDDNNNGGFEKLSEKSNPFGLFVLEIRQKIVQIIEKEKDVTTFGLKLIFIIGFIIYFGFAMSSKYGKPAFPIDGNVFHGNSGFALFFLVIFTIFVIAWEKFLSRYIDHLFESISISTEQNESWITIRSIMHRFS
ncbi:unnamed protein product, partial [Rotaria magnacalcarata]